MLLPPFGHCKQCLMGIQISQDSKIFNLGRGNIPRNGIIKSYASLVAQMVKNLPAM